MSLKKIERRDLLNLSGMIGAAAGMETPGLLRLSAAEIEAAKGNQKQWIPAASEACGGGTGAIAPHAANAVGTSTDLAGLEAPGARMCPAGSAAILSLYDPERVKTPLKCSGARGSGQFQPISYEQAVEEIARELGSLKTAGGPESLVWFTEDNGFSAIQESFCNAYGTPNFLRHSTSGDAARHLAFERTLGHGRPLPDLRHANYMLLFGLNPLAMKSTPQPRLLLEALARGAKLTVADPLCSETAGKALASGGRWLAIRPATEGALALALAHVIISEGLYDDAFVRNWSSGFEQFSAFVEAKTPEWAAGITGIAASTIREVARELAATRPALVDVRIGTGQSNGTEAARAIAMLAGLIGQVDAPGSLILPECVGPKFETGRTATGPRLFADCAGAIKARDAMITGLPYRPRAAFFVLQNFVLSVPYTAKTLAALGRLELIVAVDTHLNETAMLADYVLPGTSHLERHEILPQSGTCPAVSLRQPVVAPVNGQKPEYEFLQMLALRMGFDSYPFNVPYQTYLDDALRAGLGFGLKELRNMPGATWIGSGTRHRKYRGAGFATPSAKFEFYSQQLADQGLNPMPEYVPAFTGPTMTRPYHVADWTGGPATAAAAAEAALAGVETEPAGGKPRAMGMARALFPWPPEPAAKPSTGEDCPDPEEVLVRA